MLNKGLVFREPAEERFMQPDTPFGGPAELPPAPREPGEPILDPKALAQLERLDPSGANGFLERVLRTFLSSAARLAAKLADAREADDPKSIRLVVHTLKSSSASIGATTLSTLCATLEKALVAGTASAELAQELDAMNAALERTSVAIRQRLDSAR